MLKFTVCAMTDGVEYVELEEVGYLEFIERGLCYWKLRHLII